MKAFFIFLFVFLLASCSSKNKVPPDILPRDKMQAVLWDVIRTDEFVLNYVKNDSLHNRKEESSRLYENIFRIHKTNRDQFKKSVIYYSGHPDQLKVILDSMERMKTTIMQDLHKRPVLPDTTRKRAPLTDSARKRLSIHDSTHKNKKLKLSLRK